MDRKTVEAQIVAGVVAPAFIKENLMPPMKWFTAYEGEESWREVLENFNQA